MCSRNSRSSRANSCGASACSEITPITSPSRSNIGTDTSDWKCSSSNSGKYFTRGSASAFSSMKADRRVSATQPTSPSPRSTPILSASAAYGSDDPRSTSRSPSRSQMRQAWHCVASVARRTTPDRIDRRSGPEPIVRMMPYRYARSSARRGGEGGADERAGDCFVCFLPISARDATWSCLARQTPFARSVWAFHTYPYLVEHATLGARIAASAQRCSRTQGGAVEQRSRDVPVRGRP